MICKHCGKLLHCEGSDVRTLIDDTGGDVCGWDGGNEPHEARFIKLTYNEWFDQYRPVLNPVLNDPAGSFDGTMLETYGADLAHVLAVHRRTPQHVWTLLDCDGGLYVGPGYHLVNRMGYFITEEHWEDAQMEIVVDEPDEDDEPDNEEEKN